MVLITSKFFILGTFGHIASSAIKKLTKEYFYNKSNYVHFQNHFESKGVNSFDVYAAIINNNFEIIENYFKFINDAICGKYDEKMQYSGSTLNLVIILGKKVICANVGDSRTIICEKDGDFYKDLPLSFDHKPDLPREKERIMIYGGTVSQCEYDGEYSGPYRVYIRDDNRPGLAMSRSIGDIVAKGLGVTAIPGKT